MAGVVAGTLLVNALGEETGWRGFALPGFRSWHAKLQASVLQVTVDDSSSAGAALDDLQSRGGARRPGCGWRSA